MEVPAREDMESTWFSILELKQIETDNTKSLSGQGGLHTLLLLFVKRRKHSFVVQVIAFCQQEPLAGKVIVGFLSRRLVEKQAEGGWILTMLATPTPINQLFQMHQNNLMHKANWLQ